MKMMINENSNTFSPSTGVVFNTFLQSKDFLSQRGKTLLEKETVDILSQCLPPNFSGVESTRTTNLVVGYVQSGKTLSFTALSALAKDNGYRIIIYFAGVTNNLLEQTTQRLRKDLNFQQGIKIYNPSDTVFRDSFSRVLSMKDSLILLPILKHGKYISDLASFFKGKKS